MKLLASLAIGMATFLLATFALAAPAAAGDDDVSIGVKLGPLCVGLCIDGDHGDRHRGQGRHNYRRDNAYYDDGFYARREDYYHQRYDRRPYPDYAEARNDGYAGYRRHGGKHRDNGYDSYRRHGGHHDDGDDGDDDDDDDGDD